MKPLAIDLCCGYGGFTEGLIRAGYDVIGFDVLPMPRYPGQLVVQDIRTLHGKQFKGKAILIVAAPPCQEFSRHDQPWTRAKNPPPPDKSIWQACERIAHEAELPLIIENVRGAQPFMGKAKLKHGNRHFWGDIPPLYVECAPKPGKYCLSPSVDRPWIRSKVQPEIGEAIGRYFLTGEFMMNSGIFGFDNSQDCKAGL